MTIPRPFPLPAASAYTPAAVFRRRATPSSRYINASRYINFPRYINAPVVV